MKVHFDEKHKSLPLTKYEHLWKLERFEISEMKKIWEKRQKVTVKRAKKSKIPPLVISENHRARIPNENNTGTDRLSGAAEPHSRVGENSDVLGDSENESSGEESLASKELGEEPEGEISYEINEVDNEDNAGIFGEKMDVDEGEKGLEIQETTFHVRNSTDFDMGPMEDDSIQETEMNTRDEGRNEDQPANIESDSGVGQTSQEAATAIGPESPDAVEETSRPKRKRVARKLVLDGCLCGLVLDGRSGGVVRCNQSGCETQWYHLQCVDLELEPRNWVCAACEASSGARGGKRGRK
ncbi:hypothetical protein BYT27DRAFT_7258615 [Phlegmacium glaucopus]|nr:hypothetical protein BYT27DRAFT_7258615 [Phlegmacium glaucopus]